MTTVPENIIARVAGDDSWDQDNVRESVESVLELLAENKIVLVSPETLAAALQKEFSFIRGGHEQWLKAATGVIEKVKEEE